MTMAAPTNPVTLAPYSQRLLRQFASGRDRVVWVLCETRDADGQRWRWKRATLHTKGGGHERIADWDVEAVNTSEERI